MYIQNSNFSNYSNAEVKEALTGTIVEYELSTPLEIPFTEAQRTAKAQIDNLYSYKGTTHITSEANLDVTYRKDQDLENKNLQAQIDELKTSILSLGGNV